MLDVVLCPQILLIDGTDSAVPIYIETPIQCPSMYHHPHISPTKASEQIFLVSLERESFGKALGPLATIR